jgi:hypothetical protein
MGHLIGVKGISFPHLIGVNGIPLESRGTLTQNKIDGLKWDTKSFLNKQYLAFKDSLT